MSPIGGSSMHKAQSDSLGQGNEGNMVNPNGVASATANYRAAGIVAAAARAERDYHLATLHLQTKLAEAAERRALTNLSASMQGPMKDDYEVAQACLNLRTDGKDGMYPMVDPNYPRMADVPRRNGPDVPPSMPHGGPMMQNPSYNGHPRYMNPHTPQIAMMDPHMHPLQNPQLEPMPREMHPHGPMAGGMPYMAEYHVGLNGKRKYDPSITAEGEYTKKMKSAFQGSNGSTTIKNQDTKKGKRPADMPRRPLSAYNFFFSEERERVLASLPSPDSKDDPKKKTDSEDKSKDMKGEDAVDKSKDVKVEDAGDKIKDVKAEDTVEGNGKFSNGTIEGGDDATRETDGTFKENDGTSKETDGTSKETDGTSKETDGTPKETDGTPKETDGTPKETDGTPKEINDNSINTDDTPKDTDETDKATDDTPAGIEKISNGNENSPKCNNSTPKESNSTPEVKNDNPEGSDTTSKANNVTPESVGATPEGSEGTLTVVPKNPQSNQDRLLSLRLVQHNIRRPHRKTHGKIGFKALAKLIGERWRALNAEQKVPYRKLAETDLARYKEQMEEYNRKNKWAFLQDSDSQPPPVKLI